MLTGLFFFMQAEQWQIRRDCVYSKNSPAGNKYCTNINVGRLLPRLYIFTKLCVCDLYRVSFQNLILSALFGYRTRSIHDFHLFYALPVKKFIFRRSFSRFHDASPTVVWFRFHGASTKRYQGDDGSHNCFTSSLFRTQQKKIPVQRTTDHPKHAFFHRNLFHKIPSTTKAPPYFLLNPRQRLMKRQGKVIRRTTHHYSTVTFFTSSSTLPVQFLFGESYQKLTGKLFESCERTSQKAIEKLNFYFCPPATKTYA